MTFQSDMAANLDYHHRVRGKVIYEIGADPHLLSAAALVERGAAAVLATNLGRNWFYRPVQRGVLPMSLDVTKAADCLGGETVDAVYGINIMEHIADVPAALAEIGRILRSGGVFLLHGHPIWSGPTGHHWLYHKEGYAIDFQRDTNPLPSWAHLYMEENEIREFLLASGFSDGAIHSAIEHIFHTPDLNRLSLRRLDAAFAKSGLEVDRRNTDAEAQMDGETLSRIQRGAWWDPEERYAVRQCTWIGHKG